MTDHAPTPFEALRRYCELMDGWCAAVRTRADLGDRYPVAAEPTAENAKQLELRIALLRSDIFPELESAQRA